MSISSLEDQLLEAQARWYDILGEPLEEVIAAREALLSAERALSLAKGEETALACQWEVPSGNAYGRTSNCNRNRITDFFPHGLCFALLQLLVVLPNVSNNGPLAIFAQRRSSMSRRKNKPLTREAVLRFLQEARNPAKLDLTVRHFAIGIALTGFDLL